MTPNGSDDRFTIHTPTTLSMRGGRRKLDAKPAPPPSSRGPAAAQGIKIRVPFIKRGKR